MGKYIRCCQTHWVAIRQVGKPHGAWFSADIWIWSLNVAYTYIFLYVYIPYLRLAAGWTWAMPAWEYFACCRVPPQTKCKWNIFAWKNRPAQKWGANKRPKPKKKRKPVVGLGCNWNVAPTDGAFNALHIYICIYRLTGIQKDADRKYSINLYLHILASIFTHFLHIPHVGGAGLMFK